MRSQVLVKDEALAASSLLLTTAIGAALATLPVRAANYPTLSGTPLSEVVADTGVVGLIRHEALAVEVLGMGGTLSVPSRASTMLFFKAHH